MGFALISASPADWLKMAAAAAFVVGFVLAARAANMRQHVSSSGPVAGLNQGEEAEQPGHDPGAGSRVVTPAGAVPFIPGWGRQSGLPNPGKCWVEQSWSKGAVHGDVVMRAAQLSCSDAS
jgi:hypothetical protein